MCASIRTTRKRGTNREGTTSVVPTDTAQGKSGFSH